MNSISSSSHKHALQTIAERSTVTLAIFSGMLALSLIVSEIFLLPQLTHVEIANENRDIASLKKYHASLSAQVLQKEEERNTLLLPVLDERYMLIKKQKNQQRDIVTLKHDLEQFAEQFHAPDRVAVLHGMHYTPEDHLIRIKGDIRHVGPRSMTVLAEFVENLRELSFIASVSNPSFQRLTDETIGSFSPFTLTITLQ